MKPTPGYKPPKSYLQFNGDGTVTAVGKAWKKNYPFLKPKPQSRIIRMPRKVLVKCLQDMSASWQQELAWAAEHPGQTFACHDLGRILWVVGTIESLTWLLTHPEGAVPDSVMCERRACFCHPPLMLTYGELCEKCEADRKAWNRSAEFNNEVINPLRDLSKGLKRIFKYIFKGAWL